MLKFKVGDKVKVTAGKDKDREAEIEKVFSADKKVLLPGINMYKKHVKGFQGQKGGIYDIPRALPFANIALICPKCKKQTRVGFKMAGKEKVRICKKCNKEITVKQAKKK